jgi:hypothetical protein
MFDMIQQWIRLKVYHLSSEKRALFINIAIFLDFGTDQQDMMCERKDQISTTLTANIAIGIIVFWPRILVEVFIAEYTKV